MKSNVFIKFALAAFFISTVLTASQAAASGNMHNFYAGATSQEGVLNFAASVDLRSVTPPTDEEARAQIQRQYFYMLGNLRWGVEGLAATPSKSYTLSNIVITPSNESGLYKISYAYESNIALELAQKTGELKFDLPRDPSAMAELYGHECSGDKSEPNWYGYNPHLQGCSLVAGKDYDLVVGHVTVKMNTVESYPEYKKLVGADGLVHMSILMYDEITKTDGVVAKLTAAGFARHTWSEDEITAFLGFTPFKMPQVEDFTLRSPNGGGMKVSLFYGDANIDSPSAKAFRYFYKDAIENSNIVVYNGHSGLSRNVDLSLIEQRENFKIKMKSDYQLYFLAGCITYGYYVDSYLARKATPTDPRGTKNMDVITFGTASPGFDDKPLFSVMDAVIDFAVNAKRTSYQDITKKISYSWFGVVGDEDNQD